MKRWLFKINLSYIMLAQRMLREDRAIGMFRLRAVSQYQPTCSRASRSRRSSLTRRQSLAVVFFRFNDHTMLSALTQPARHADIALTHAAILLAGQPAEQFARAGDRRRYRRRASPKMQEVSAVALIELGARMRVLETELTP